MNYIKELNAFRDWVMLNRPSTGQIALWHALMSVNNMTGWKDAFTVPNQTLQLMTGLSRQGLDKTRNGLIQLELIQYKKGRSNQAGTYQMISLLPECQKVGTEVGTEVGTVGASEESHQGRGGSTLFKQNKTKQNETKKKKEQKEKAAPSSSSSKSKQDEQVNEIWTHYKSTFDGLFSRLTLTEKRKKAIKARLNDGLTEKEIKIAISNIRKSSFHCGDNDKNKFYADITFVCRSLDKIEEWLNYQPSKKAVKQQGGKAHAINQINGGRNESTPGKKKRKFSVTEMHQKRQTAYFEKHRAEFGL